MKNNQEWFINHVVKNSVRFSVFINTISGIVINVKTANGIAEGCVCKDNKIIKIFSVEESYLEEILTSQYNIEISTENILNDPQL